MNIAADTLAILSALTYPSPHSVRIVESLDRKAYSKTNAVLEALGGKWSRKAKAHEFAVDARERIDHAITTGEVETGQDVGWFPSPPAVVSRLIALAMLELGSTVLEPSAGDGAIVKALLGFQGQVSVVAVERDRERRAGLDRLAFGAGDWRLRVAATEDFMDFLPMYGGEAGAKRFDRVVMNPPFCKVGKGDHLDHVRHAHSLLRADGRLVSVLPSSVTFRRDRRHIDFRDWVDENGGEIEELPAGSFKASGTGVNAVIVVVPS